MTLTQYSMEDEEAIITEFEMKEDLINSYSNNKDISFINLNLKSKVEKFPIGTLLEVTKKIGSQIKIISIKEVDDAFVSSMLGD